MYSSKEHYCSIAKPAFVNLLERMTDDICRDKQVDEEEEEDVRIARRGRRGGWEDVDRAEVGQAEEDTLGYQANADLHNARRGF